MNLLLDTSSAVCRLTLVEGDWRVDSEWEAGRSLAKGLLAYIETELRSHGKIFADITGIGAYKGPGSFTGLRIGLTVMNTMADALSVPIVGETGDMWQQQVLSRLGMGENDRIVVPLYGSEAHITTPRK